MASKFKVILTVGGIFLTGAVTGGFAGFRLANHYAGPKQPQPRGEITNIFSHLAEELEFTPEQKERIRPILGRASEELKRIRGDTFSRVSELVAATDNEMSAALTPEQREQLREIRAREERRRQTLFERARAKAVRATGESGQKPDHPDKP